MWEGRRYWLRRNLHAIEKLGDRELRTVIPEGETVEVVSGPHPSFIRLVELRWINRVFVSFAADLQACGEEILERLAS